MIEEIRKRQRPRLHGSASHALASAGQDCEWLLAEVERLRAEVGRLRLQVPEHVWKRIEERISDE